MNQATEEYNAAHANVTEQITRLVQVLEDHKERQSEVPNHFGYIEDLLYVNIELQDLNAYMEGTES